MNKKWELCHAFGIGVAMRRDASHMIRSHIIQPLYVEFDNFNKPPSWIWNEDKVIEKSSHENASKTLDFAAFAVYFNSKICSNRFGKNHKDKNASDQRKWKGDGTFLFVVYILPHVPKQTLRVFFCSFQSLSANKHFSISTRRSFLQSK